MLYLLGNDCLNTGMEVVALVTVARVFWDVQFIHFGQSKFVVVISCCSGIKFGEQSWKSERIIIDDEKSRVMEI